MHDGVPLRVDVSLSRMRESRRERERERFLKNIQLILTGTGTKIFERTDSRRDSLMSRRGRRRVKDVSDGRSLSEMEEDDTGFIDERREQGDYSTMSCRPCSTSTSSSFSLLADCQKTGTGT